MSFLEALQWVAAGAVSFIGYSFLLAWTVAVVRAVWKPDR